MKKRNSRNSLHNKQNKRGFTLAEFLIAAGILAILAAFGFVAVVSYQRKLKLTEMDDTAREIFVAAQNHLTAAKASGEWDELYKKRQDISGTTDFGNNIESYEPADYTGTWPEGGVEKEENTASGEIVYLHDFRSVYSDATKRESQLKTSVLGVMLPYGAIDESLLDRKGSYIIEYDAATASVYGVFYSEDYRIKEPADIIAINDSRTNKNGRLDYKTGSGEKPIIGYYGGAVAQKLFVKESAAPEVKLNNGETLSVTIEDNNSPGNLYNIVVKISGKESEAYETWALTLNEGGEKADLPSGATALQKDIHDSWTVKTEGKKKVYNLVFDDITKKKRHFADLFPGFIPGEDLTIEVSFTSTGSLSSTQTVLLSANSLFESRTDAANETGTPASKGTDAAKSEVKISCIRHLENLSSEISKLPMAVGKINDNEKYVTSAVQTKDLNWDSTEAKAVYQKENDTSVVIYDVTGSQQDTASHSFCGIRNYALEKYTGFDGEKKEHKKISNLPILQEDSKKGNNNGGLFADFGGTYNGFGYKGQEISISGLTLENFTVKIKGGNAGTLVGDAGKEVLLKVEDVYVVNPTVNATVSGYEAGGVAGGLVGVMGTESRIEGCGVYFDDDNELSESEKYKTGAYDISESDGNYTEEKLWNGKYHIYSKGEGAGGLVGQIQSASTTNLLIKNSFASVPVITRGDNAPAGGLIGIIDGGWGNKLKVTNCYSGGYTESGSTDNNIYGIACLSTENYAGGLIGFLSSEQPSIENCYSTCSVFGAKSGGITGYDVSTSRGVGSKYKNCYTVSRVLSKKPGSESGTITVSGAFASDLQNQYTTFENCYYISEINPGLRSVGMSSPNLSRLLSKHYEEMKTAGFLEDAENGAPENLAGKNHETHPYNTERKDAKGVYPFATVNTTAQQSDNAGISGVHYGDWYALPGQKSGLVYYEKTGTGTSYHGWLYNGNKDTGKEELWSKTSKDTFTKESGQYVTEDGYLLLLPKGMDLKTIQVAAGGGTPVSGDKIFLEKKADNILSKELTEKYDAYYLNIGAIDEKVFSTDAETHLQITGGVEADFSMTPYFADSVTCGEEKETAYYIRSARHLASLEGGSGYTGKSGYTFIQQMDIDCTLNSYTYKNVPGMGADIDTVFSAPISNMQADYTSETYVNSEDGNTYSYKIKGLKTSMFSTMGKDATVKGVVLTDLQYSGSGKSDSSVAGFADTNSGTIESCGIRPDNSSYGNVNISNGNNQSILSVSGFVADNEGTITNSYVTGEISLQGSNAQRGIAGFAFNNSGTINSCYANCVLTASNLNPGTYIGGFSGMNQGGTITGCYAVGEITSKDSKGFLGGFLGANAGEISDSYCAQWKIDGDGYYGFGADYDGTAEDCYYYAGTQVTGIPGEEEFAQGEPMYYAELEQLAKNKADNNTTKKYSEYNKDSADTVYPFNLAKSGKAYTSTQHYGDWPENKGNAELAYYEIYMTSDYKYSLGIQCKGLEIDTIIEDPDKVNKDIVQDGYVLLTTADGSYSVDGTHCPDIESVKFIYDTNPQISAENGLTWTADVLKKDTMLKDKSGNYWLKFFPLSRVDEASGAAYYKKVQVTGGPEDVYFYYNPHYAKSEVQKCKIDDNCTLDPPAEIVIRTERQYSMMTQDLQNPGDGNPAFKVYQNSSFRQDVDLYFGDELTYTEMYFDELTNETEKQKANGSLVPAISPVSAAANTINTEKPQDTYGFRGTYDGKNHSIKGLSITQKDGKSAGMFGNTQGAIIRNLSLDSASVTGQDYAGVVVGSAAHLAGGVNEQMYTVIQNVKVENSNVTGSKYVGGLVGAGYSCSVNPDGGKPEVRLSKTKVVGDSCVGGVFGYLSDYSAKLLAGIPMNNIAVEDVQLEETAAHSSDKNYGIGGFAGRIATVYGLAAKNKNTVISASNIHISDLLITINENKANGYIAAGLFGGSLYYGRDEKEGRKALTISFDKCTVSGSEIITYAGSSDYKASFGGLFGTVKCERTDDVITIDRSMLGAGNSVTADIKNPFEHICAGGLAGTAEKINLVLTGTGGYNMPSFHGLTGENTTALGGYIGYFNDSSVSNCSLGNLALPTSGEGKVLGAENLGGFIGYSQESQLSGINISGLSGGAPLNSVNAGGITGKAVKTAFTDVTVSGNETAIQDESEKSVLIDASGISTENFGTVAGYAGEDSYNSISADRVTIHSAKSADGTDETNMGGLIGKSEGSTYVENTYIAAEGISVEDSGESVFDNAGGVIGNSTGKDKLAIHIGNVSVGVPAANKGGALGRFAGAQSSLDLTADTVKITGAGNNVGGVIGLCAGGSGYKIPDINVSGVNIAVSKLGNEMNAGGAVGKITSGAVETISGSGIAITAQDSGLVNSSIGGLIGSVQGKNTKLAALSASGEVQINNSSAHNIGGVVGSMSNEAVIENIDSSKCELSVAAYLEGGSENIGGVLGCLLSGTVNKVSASADLSVTKQRVTNLGGGVGLLSGGTLADITVGSSLGEGAKAPTGNMTVSSKENGVQNLGGMVGCLTNGSITGTVQNVQVTADNVESMGGFVGYVNGNIRNCKADNIRIVNESQSRVGGFAGTLDGGVVTNCDVRLSALGESDKNAGGSLFAVSSNAALSDVGGFAGLVKNGAIRECFAAIPVKGEAGNMGGFAGKLQNSAIISNSYASCAVAGEPNIQGSYVGGFIGTAEAHSSITNCYSSGDVNKGGTVGGFAGRLSEDAVIYMNNCYSLGSVSQLNNKHGGFVGAYEGKFIDTPEESMKDYVDLFYELLNFNLIDAKNKEEDENGIYHLCVEKLVGRGIDEERFGSIYDYIMASNLSDVDSTAVRRNNLEEYSGNNLPVAAVINELMKTEEFSSLSAIFKDWHLAKNGKKINFLYTSYDITAEQAKGNKSIACVNYIPDGKDSYTIQTGRAELSENKTYENTYGIYYCMRNFNESTAGVEQFNGCVYLSDASYSYNISKDWADQELSKDKAYLQTKSFSGMTKDNSSYVSDLNKNRNDYSVVERFAGQSEVTYRYDKNLPEENYPYPTLVGRVGCGLEPLTHWGDWPLNGEADGGFVYGLVYYEKISGSNKIYYHGWGSKDSRYPLWKEKNNYVELKTPGDGLEKGLVTGADKYVTEEGYLLLVPKDAKMTELKVDFGNTGNYMVTIGSSYDIVSSPFGSHMAYKIPSEHFWNSVQQKEERVERSDADSPKNLFKAKKGLVVVKTNATPRAQFNLTLYFADSVGRISEGIEDKNYYIRSAGQLAELEKQDGYTSSGEAADKNVFHQQLDISFNNETMNASFDEPIKEMKATYISDMADKDRTYKIQGLKTNMFDKNSGTLKGITLTDLKTDVSEETPAEAMAGLVLENTGTIESCSIRADEESGKGYEKVKITNPNGQAAGLVHENKGTISNSYVTGTVSGKSASGLVSTNSGTIENCYANSIVTGTDSASGFCDSNEGDIRVSSSTGAVKSEKKANGFVGKNEGVVNDCYSAPLSVEGMDVYLFGFLGGTLAEYKDCCWLEGEVIGEVKDDKSGAIGEAVTYSKLAEDSNSPATHKYNSTAFDTADTETTVYPFPLESTEGMYLPMQYWGDWPKNPDAANLIELPREDENQTANGTQTAPVAGIAYREADASGYEGWYAITAVQNSGDTKAAGQGGGDIKAASRNDGDTKAEDQNAGDIVTNELTPYDTLRTDRNIAIGDEGASCGILVQAGTAPQYTGVQAEEEKTSQVTIDGVLYDYYRIITDGKVHQDIGVRVKAGDTEFAFTCNPDFAAAVSYEMPLGTKAEDGGRPYQVRTEAQLRSINANRELYTKAAFRQTLDIALEDGNFAPIGGVADWADGSFSGEAADSAAAFTGSYDAGLVAEGKKSTDSSGDSTESQTQDEVKIPEGYCITGLEQTVALTAVDGNGYTGDSAYRNDENKLMYTGLFARVEGTVRNVNVSGTVNLVQGQDGSRMKAYAGGIAGVCGKSGSILSCNSDVTINIDSECTEINVGGLAGYSDGTIESSYYNDTINGTVKLSGSQGSTAAAGGAVGTNTGSVTRTAACAVISLKAENLHKDTDSYLGGFAGRSYGKDSTVTDSWSKCFLEGNGSVTGGFVGLAAGDKKEYTVFTDNYAVISIQNPEKAKSAGLFAGYMQTDQIWRCHAVSLDGDVTEEQVFANGVAMDWESRDCYLMPGADRDILAGLNGGDMFEFINGMYPTLHDNPERETDIIGITSVGGSLQREEEQSQTDKVQGDISDGTQGVKPEGESDVSQSTVPKDENTDSTTGGVNEVPADTAPDNQEKDGDAETGGTDNSSSGQNHSQGTTDAMPDTSNAGENQAPGNKAADTTPYVRE